MIIPEEEQWVRDFDWFATDESGCIGHFNTAGFKLLPQSVSASAEDLKTVTDYFQSLMPTGAGYEVSADLEKEAGPFKSEKERARYLSGIAYLANSGLFSFDIDTYVKPGLAYFRVAVPVQPVRLESLPRKIREIVERTRFEGIRFGETSRIDYELTLYL
jgi:hypothetical protein